MRTLKLSKAVHGHFGGPSDKLQQACPHLVIPAFHSPPEPHYHGFIGRVTNIIRVLPPVFNVYLCQTTQQVLKSSMMGGGGESGGECECAGVWGGASGGTRECGCLSKWDVSANRSHELTSSSFSSKTLSRCAGISSLKPCTTA